MNAHLAEDEIRLAGVYPNPFSVNTMISFMLDHSSSVSIRVYDMNGQLLKTLVDGEMDEGEHELNWNASDVNAGIYFLQFQSEEHLQMVKLIVTK